MDAQKTDVVRDNPTAQNDTQAPGKDAQAQTDAPGSREGTQPADRSPSSEAPEHRESAHTAPDAADHSTRGTSAPSEPTASQGHPSGSTQPGTQAEPVRATPAAQSAEAQAGRTAAAHSGPAASAAAGEIASAPKPAASTAGETKPHASTTPEADTKPHPGKGSPSEPDVDGKKPLRPAATEAEEAAGKRTAAAEARATREALKDKFEKAGLKAVVKDAGKEAAKKGALIGGKLAAATMLKAGAMSVPGLGLAITAAMWMLDPEERKLWSQCWAFITPWNASMPGLNSPPTASSKWQAPNLMFHGTWVDPGPTYYLPIAVDGNRDPLIRQMDVAMTKTMATSFDFDFEKVWPTVDPEIATTTDLSGTLGKINELRPLLGDALDAIAAAYQAGVNEPYIEQVWTKTKASLDALRDVQDTVLQNIGTGLVQGAENANTAYQGFRGVNLKNRTAINNSADGFVGWLFPEIHAEDMSDSTTEMKTATTEMGRIATAMSTIADNVNVASNRTGASTTTGEQQDNPTQPQPYQQQPFQPQPYQQQPLPGQQEQPNAKDKDLASMLADKLGQQVPNLSSMVPQVPNLGSMVPNLGSMMPTSSTPSGQNPFSDKDKGLTEDDVLKRLQELKADQPAKDQGTPEKPAGPTVGPQTAAPAATPAAAGPAAEPAKAAPAAPAASNTVDLKGHKVTFDNPKSAAMAQKLFTGAGATSFYSAAADAGFQVPPPGQELGTPVDVGDIKPGDAVIGNDERAVYIGEIDHKAMVLTEAGDIKPLADVAKFTGPDTGIYRMADNGTPLPSTAETVPASHTGPTPPAAAPATDPTASGVIPGQNTGATGLNPGVIPPQP